VASSLHAHHQVAVAGTRKQCEGEDLRGAISCRPPLALQPEGEEERGERGKKGEEEEHHSSLPFATASSPAHSQCLLEKGEEEGKQ